MGYAVLLFARFFGNFFKTCTNILVPVLSEQWGFSMSIGGMLTAVYFIPYAVMQIMTGPLCNRFGSFRIAFVGMATATVGALFFASGHGITAFFIGRFLFGLGTGPIYICCVYYLNRRYDSHKFALLTGLDFAIGNAAGVVATTPLKLCVDRFGVSATCIGCIYPMLLVVLALLLFAAKFNDASEDKVEGLLKQQAKAISSFKGNGNLIWASVLCICYAMTHQCYTALWCTAWAMDSFAVSQSLIALPGTLAVLATMIGSLCSELLHKKGRTFEQTTVMTGWLLIAFFGTTIAFHHLSLFAPSLVSTLLFGFALGLMSVQVFTLIRTIVGPSMATVTVGMVNFGGNIMTVVGQSVSGILIDRFSYTPTVILFWVVFLVILSGFSINIRKRTVKAA